jgi:cytochrome c553
LLRTTSNFSIGSITVLVASNSLPAMATDGKDLTLNGNGKGAHACSACHATQGEGPEAGYPRLVGLSADYLLRQLNDFANNRENELLAPIANSLSREERKAVAAYYASVSSAEAKESKKLNQTDVTRGAVVANEGQWSGGLPAMPYSPQHNGITVRRLSQLTFTTNRPQGDLCARMEEGRYERDRRRPINKRSPHKPIR